MSEFWFGIRIGVACGLVLACLVALVLLLALRRRRPAMHEVSTLVQGQDTDHVDVLETRYKMTADTPPIVRNQPVSRAAVKDAPASIRRLLRGVDDSNVRERESIIRRTIKP